MNQDEARRIAEAELRDPGLFVSPEPAHEEPERWIFGLRVKDAKSAAFGSAWISVERKTGAVNHWGPGEREEHRRQQARAKDLPAGMPLLDYFDAMDD